MKALIVVDVQNWLMEKAIYKKEELIATINKAIREFRVNRDLIVFIQHNNKFLLHDTPAWGLFERLDREPGDIVIQKKRADAFEETELSRMLKERGVSRVYVCGLVSHGCVKATCLGALRESFQVVLIANGHSNWQKDASKTIDRVHNEVKAYNVPLIEK